jgi:hypothetical protein
MMAWPGRELSIAKSTQLPAHRPLGDADPEHVPDPLAQVDDPPAHNAADRGDGSTLDHRDQRDAMRLVQTRWVTRRLAIDQTVRTMAIELQHPVPHDLQRHPADLFRLCPARSVIDRS